MVPSGGSSTLDPSSCPRYQLLKYFLYSHSARYPNFQFRLLFVLFYGKKTSVTWCWGHQLRSAESRLGNMSHQLDPGQYQFVARSEICALLKPRRPLQSMNPHIHWFLLNSDLERCCWIETGIFLSFMQYEWWSLGDRLGWYFQGWIRFFLVPNYLH